MYNSLSNLSRSDGLIRPFPQLLINNNYKKKSSAGSSAKTNTPVGTKTNDNQDSQRKQTQGRSAPVTYGRVTSVSKPRITSKNGNTFITHRQYVRTILSSDSTNHQFSFLVAPANAGLFPWLSSLALSYETYKFHKIKFDYVPKCPSTVRGSINFAVDWDPTDSPPSSLEDILQMEGARSSNPWMAFNLSVPKQRLNKRETLYVSSSGEPNRFTDVGRFICYTEAGSDSFSYGNLWVEYEIELKTPQKAETTSEQKLIYPMNSQANPFVSMNYSWAGGLNFEYRPEHPKRIYFKQPFEGMLLVRVRADSSVRGLGIEVAGTGWAACRRLSSQPEYSFSNGNSHILYMVLIKMTSPNNHTYISLHCDESMASHNEEPIGFSYWNLLFSRGDIALMNNMFTPYGASNAHWDIVPWNIPPKTFSTKNLPLDQDYP